MSMIQNVIASPQGVAIQSFLFLDCHVATLLAMTKKRLIHINR